MAEPPPPPAGFTLDAPQRPPPPAGFAADVPAPRQSTLTEAQPQQDRGSALGAVWQGFLKEAGDTARGAAQLATRMPMPRAGMAGATLGLPQRGDLREDVERSILASDQAYEADPQRQAHPWASAAGRVFGGLASTAPLAMIPGGAALRGASLGARLGAAALGGAAGAASAPVAAPKSSGDYWTEKAKQAGIGAGAGAAIPGLGAAFRPGSAAQAMTSQGVQLTPGQQLGAGARHVERALQTFPILRGMIQRGEARSVEGFDRATMNQALDPIGVTIGPNVKAGHDLITEGASAASAAYDRVLPHVHLVEDDGLKKGLADLRNLVAEGGSDLLKRFDLTMKRAVDTRFGAEPPAPASSLRQPPRTDEIGLAKSLGPELVPAQYAAPRPRNMDGRSLKDVERDLDKAIRLNRGGNSDATQRQLSDALQEARSIIFRSLARQNPEHASALTRLDSTWAMLSRLRDAANRKADSEGTFTPRDLLQVIRTGENRYGNQWSFAKGEGLMQAFAEEGNRALGKTSERQLEPHGLLHETARLLTGIIGAPLYQASRVLPAVGRGLEAGAPAAPAAGREAGDLEQMAKRKSQLYEANRRGDIPKMQELMGAAR